jgi:hypothetical protein
LAALWGVLSLWAKAKRRFTEHVTAPQRENCRTPATVVLIKRAKFCCNGPTPIVIARGADAAVDRRVHSSNVLNCSSADMSQRHKVGGRCRLIPECVLQFRLRCRTFLTGFPYLWMQNDITEQELGGSRRSPRCPVTGPSELLNSIYSQRFCGCCGSGPKSARYAIPSTHASLSSAFEL